MPSLESFPPKLEQHVERIARAACIADGHNPDLQYVSAVSRPEPVWHCYKTTARMYIAMRAEETNIEHLKCDFRMPRASSI